MRAEIGHPTRPRRPRAFPPATPLFQELLPFASFATVPKGELLFRPDQPAPGVYLIGEGSVTLLWTTQRSIRTLATAGPGSVIGVAAALNGRESVTARAAHDTAVGFVSTQTLLQQMDANPRIRTLVLNETARETLQVESFIASNATRIGWRFTY